MSATNGAELSVDLGVHGRDAETRPPVEAYLRVIDEPLLVLTSVDLKATARIDNLGEVFDFAKDYLGLLKAAVIAGNMDEDRGLAGRAPIAQNLGQRERIVAFRGVRELDVPGVRSWRWRSDAHDRCWS